jgi:HlyD family secretion protein
VLSIPIQALTVRKKGDLEPPKEGVLASTESPVDKTKDEEIQGVFVVSNGHAEFRKVETGITGATDIEVLSSVQDNDHIITGSYKVIRTIRNAATVKVDNRAPSAIDTKS